MILRIVLGAALLCLSLLTHVLHAQTDTIDSPMNILHGVYAQLDATKMPHGLLWQSCFPIVNLPHYTGDRAEHDSLRIDVNTFGKLLFTVGSGLRDTLQPALFDLGYRDHYVAKASSEHVELTGVLVAGGHLLYTAFAAGWLAPSSDSTRMTTLAGTRDLPPASQQ